MSVLIKGMEMPKKCNECAFRHLSLTENDYCTANHEIIPWGVAKKERLQNCPLVEVPPHGRLIDADSLPINDPIKSMMMFGGQIVISKDAIDNAPTIIETEDGE